MAEQRSGKIMVHVDPDLADLIPGYLANRQKDIVAISVAIEKKDLETIRILGHSMKGSGGGYGFDAITDIGAALEKAAQEGREEVIRREIIRLEDYLHDVVIVCD
jgi:HPt (histidine-containing phosphotransfer) domain-containing protein